MFRVPLVTCVIHIHREDLNDVLCSLTSCVGGGRWSCSHFDSQLRSHRALDVAANPQDFPMPQVVEDNVEVPSVDQFIYQRTVGQNVDVPVSQIQEDRESGRFAELADCHVSLVKNEIAEGLQPVSQEYIHTKQSVNFALPPVMPRIAEVILPLSQERVRATQIEDFLALQSRTTSGR